jgi:hypothetical protein
MKAAKRLFPGAGPYGRSTPVLPCPSMPSKIKRRPGGAKSAPELPAEEKARITEVVRWLVPACLGVRPFLSALAWRLLARGRLSLFSAGEVSRREDKEWVVKGA